MLDHCWSTNTCSAIIAKTNAGALSHYRTDIPQSKGQAGRVAKVQPVLWMLCTTVETGNDYVSTVLYNYYWVRAKVIGASLSEPHTGQTASPAMFIYVYIYLCLYRTCTSFRKCPRILIHWTASILLSVIQFRKCHHVQIIETASILHLQWATTIQLGQAESVNYSYSELSYMSEKLYRSSVNWQCIVQGAICRGPQQLRLCITCNNATDIELHVHLCCWCSRYSSSWRLAPQCVAFI